MDLRTKENGDIVILYSLEIRKSGDKYQFFCTSKEIDSRDGTERWYSGGTEDFTEEAYSVLSQDEMLDVMSKITKVYCSKQA